MYEQRSVAPIPRRLFARRFALHFAAAQVVVVFSLGIGMAGYRHFEGMSWPDAFVNSCMLLGGMGPVGDLKTDAGKIFAGCYALYCGLVFLIVAGVLLAPLVHRIMHRFHWEAAKK